MRQEIRHQNHSVTWLTDARQTRVHALQLLVAPRHEAWKLYNRLWLHGRHCLPDRPGIGYSLSR